MPAGSMLTTKPPTGSDSDSDYFMALIAALRSEPYKEYWSELGQLIHAFSIVERRLLGLLHKWAGVTDIVAGILFSGTRADSAKDHINRILEATGKNEIKERLKRPLDQFSVINTVRNHLVHWGAQNDNDTGEFLVSNAFLSPVADRLKEFKISPAKMQYMRDDLDKISMCFLLESVETDWTVDPTWKDHLAEPWLYKPPQPSPRKSKPQPPRQPKEHSRQRDASRKSPRRRVDQE
jgi:hypothetical protein